MPGTVEWRRYLGGRGNMRLLHSGAFPWGKVTFALKNYISFIYKPIFTNEGLKFLGRIVLDDTL